MHTIVRMWIFERISAVWLSILKQKKIKEKAIWMVNKCADKIRQLMVVRFGNVNA